MSRAILFKILCVIVLAFSLGVFVSQIMRSARIGAKEEETTRFFDPQDFIETEESSEFFSRTLAEYGEDDYTPEEAVNISVYDTRNKAVVNITTEVLAYNWFFEPVPQEGGVGSGSIIDKRGYVLTNNHVIEDARKVFVTLWDGTKVEGDIVGVDIENDLAIVKIDPNGQVVEPIPLGKSSTLKVGQKVLAIGNPFGLDRTLTTGIISGLGRPVRSSTNIVIRNMIQTDASINPGNSGGPLLNSKGEMIGVNTIIVSPNRGSVGVGFAVPSETVTRIIPDLIEYGKVQRGWIEWNLQPLFPELVAYAKLPMRKGLLITNVKKRGNAEDSGIRGGDSSQAVRYGRTTIWLGGDVVVKVNGNDVESISDLLESLEQTKPDETIVVEYYRKNRLKTAKITLVERPVNLAIE